ncbi:MAG: hypothetical protein IT317_19950 [Anaerolineales bacterium]|nr:hypothetical protein [Anaerolineales bacterium]
MSLTLTLNNTAAKFTLWTAQHPTAARALLVTLPFVAALVTALVTRQPVYACGTGPGAGCGGG